MNTTVVVLVVVLLLVVLYAFMAVKIVKQYERGVLFRLGRLHGTRRRACD